ncbi:MAG TPA: hypothetical protein VEA69_01880, partial [Tepidisphaeraceae bacterium]|nr:hypothetical protein [Tepidisphaeraceae bacterium]
MTRVLPLLLVALPTLADPLSPVDTFPYALGTQSIGPAYQFTDQPKLLESAVAVRELGSNVFKFALRPEYFGPRGNVADKHPTVRTLIDLARDEPTHRRVLDAGFAHTLVWAYALTPKPWGETFAEADADKEYREIYALAVHLLRTYSGTGRAFYLGNWEGDWGLLGHYDAGRDPSPGRIASMTAWLKARQRAVDDARRDTPHRAVTLYHYVEVNLVAKAMAGKPTVTNSVLPGVPVDFVSYSAYDSLQKHVAADLPKALDYVESKLSPKPGLRGRRAFVGEYGFPAARFTPAQQDAKSREVMIAALTWGCPFVLYWQLYDNEVSPEGVHKGFWLIDDKGVKQPVYETHRAYYAWARQHVADHVARHGVAPAGDAF